MLDPITHVVRQSFLLGPNHLAQYLDLSSVLGAINTLSHERVKYSFIHSFILLRFTCIFSDLTLASECLACSPPLPTSHSTAA